MSRGIGLHSRARVLAVNNDHGINDRRGSHHVCTMSRSGREPRITVDGRILSWRKFGALLCTFAGWGMRIEFVDEHETHRRPPLKVGEKEKSDRPPAE